MRLAAPAMSAFFIYIISLASSVVAFRKVKNYFRNRQFAQSLGFLIISLSLIYYAGVSFNQDANAIKLADEMVYAPNNPVGIPKGLFPGRVVWVWDNEASDESCTNSSDDWWFLNTSGEVVDSMLIRGILAYTEEESLQNAWDELFRHFNSNHGKGDVGYTAGEKIYIKINLTNSNSSVSGTTKYTDFERMDATPEVVLALLKQLINVVGVAESDIFLGDPFRTFHDYYWDFCHAVFPDVIYCDGIGLNGRYQTQPTSEHIMKFSDGLYDYRIPGEYTEASYLINLACLKSHDSGGITLAAKNHQGSVLQDGVSSDDQSAYQMHYALPDHDDAEGGVHRYRHLVDYMGHEQLGGKTLLSIIDGIWAGKSWEGYVEKWQMAPFNNDYPNSIFLSQDPVAIESVCWDFLLKEYENKPADEKYPYMDGTEDYIRQAADPSYWPEEIIYDPEGDGTPLGSMGVYEHWNNASEMSYTSIDFVKVLVNHSANPDAISVRTRNADSESAWLKLYPNPASEYIFIEYTLNEPSEVSIELYTLKGDLVVGIPKESLFSGSQQTLHYTGSLKPGAYLVKVCIESQGEKTIRTGRIQLI